MKSEIKTIGVIGAGRFGRAFVQGILKSKLVLANQIWASARTNDNLEKVKALAVKAVKNYHSELSTTDILILSVKPAQIESVILDLCTAQISDKTLIISVAAGTPIRKIEELLNSKSAVIRAMPNSPCAVQSGVTAICAGSRATEEHLNIAKQIFETLGICISIEEKFFDLVTALSGSGPAYFYLFMETMIEVAVKAGISRSDAILMASQTALGAAKMVQETKRSPDALKQDVATPGGCTMEALKVLENKKLSSIFSEAIQRANDVASRLGQKN